MTETTEEKIKAAVKMTDKEFSDFFMQARDSLDKIPPGAARQRAVNDFIIDFDVTYGNDMDIRHHYNPPMDALELMRLVTQYFVEFGYINKDSLNSVGHLKCE